MFLFMMVTVVYMNFATDVLLVAPAVVGTIFFVSKIWDAITDPMESYMWHQGTKFVERYDANSYLRIMEAWQRFDLAADAGVDGLIVVDLPPEEDEELCLPALAAGIKFIRLAVLGKFLAAWLFIGLALLLTFPIWITVNYLGDPDNGVILTAYIGSLLMAGGFLAIGSCISAATKNQVIAFIVSALIYPVFGSWAWGSLLNGSGWLEGLGFIDFADRPFCAEMDEIVLNFSMIVAHLIGYGGKQNAIGFVEGCNFFGISGLKGVIPFVKECFNFSFAHV